MWLHNPYRQEGSPTLQSGGKNQNWGTSGPRGVEDPPKGRAHVATQPTCGSLLILPPCCEALGTPQAAGLYSHLAHLWATADLVPPL